MNSAIAAWISGNREVYFGNATAMRDFRVQLRGSRAVMLFGTYLALLIIVALFAYASSAGAYGASIVDAQRQLQGFYSTTMQMLGLTISVVAPALTATAIVAERQRQSIDLVFSAPVSPKYYLVGKMISSYRYTWMLLVLALPITAASVVLGGASWYDVISAYILLSLQGLILTAFALLMSTLAPKPVGAIIWSYAITLVYNVVARALAASATMAYMFGRAPTDEQPCTVGFSPFFDAEAGKTYTVLAGHHIPNWILVGFIAVLIAKICLLGAGSLLNPGSSKEVAGLRLHGLIYAAAVSFALGWTMWPSYAGRGTLELDSVTKMTGSTLGGITVAWLTAPMIMFVPFLACYGFDRERRFRPNGTFNIRRILDGTPAGGLPYLLAMLGIVFGGFALGGYNRTGIGLGREYWIFAAYSTSLWLLFWALGRLCSSYLASVKTSRTLVFAIFLGVTAMPFPLLVALAGIELDPTKASLWDIYVLSPITGHHHDVGAVLLFTVVMFGLTLVATFIAESRTRKKLSTIRDYDERPYQAA